MEGAGVERTTGRPASVANLWSLYRGYFEESAAEFLLPVEYLLATALTESSGNPLALRKEPGYLDDDSTPNKISPGLMQTLLSTAQTTLSSKVTREWLFHPENSIRAGAAYIRSLAPRSFLDGPMVFASYNAGGIYQQNGLKNRWKIRQYPIGTGEHCDRAIKWFNDAVFVISLETVKYNWQWFLGSI